MTIDSGSLTFDFFDIGKSEDCPVCSNPTQVTAIETSEITATQLCSNSYNISPSEIKKLNLVELAQKLGQSYSIKSTGRFLLIKLPTGEKMTLMISGSAIIKGVDNADDAKRLYELILTQNSKVV
jgi:hypothetical protein